MSSSRPKSQAAPDLSALPPNVLAGYAAQSSFYSGPIPPPDLLREYDALEPGRAAKLLDWVMEQSHHRMHLEKRVIESDIKRSWWGLLSGLIVAIFTVGTGGAVALWGGHPTAGATIATAAVVGLVGCFIYGTTSRRAEREQKAQTLTRRK